MRYRFSILISIGLISQGLVAQGAEMPPFWGVYWQPGWGRVVSGQPPRWDPPLFAGARSGLFFPDSYLDAVGPLPELPVGIVFVPRPASAPK